jgi:hypothetical protein
MFNNILFSRYLICVQLIILVYSNKIPSSTSSFQTASLNINNGMNINSNTLSYLNDQYHKLSYKLGNLHANGGIFKHSDLIKSEGKPRIKLFKVNRQILSEKIKSYIPAKLTKLDNFDTPAHANDDENAPYDGSAISMNACSCSGIITLICYVVYTCYI